MHQLPEIDIFQPFVIFVIVQINILDTANGCIGNDLDKLPKILVLLVIGANIPFAVNFGMNVKNVMKGMN